MYKYKYIYIIKVELLNLLFSCCSCCEHVSCNVRDHTIYSLTFISTPDHASIIQSFQQVKWRKQTFSISRSRTLWGDNGRVVVRNGHYIRRSDFQFNGVPEA